LAYLRDNGAAMFKSKRPVPSPAALKVLTQLAYVSSGTALGGAVLCAEERRRRIKIAQKLADHARVVRTAIRQHPRHVSNAALAVNDGEQSGLEGWSSGDGSPKLDRRRGRRAKNHVNQNLYSEENDGVQAPELPSVVEKGYAKATASEDRAYEQTNGPARDERRTYQDDTESHASSPGIGADNDGSRPECSARRTVELGTIASTEIAKNVQQARRNLLSVHHGIAVEETKRSTGTDLSRSSAERQWSVLFRSCKKTNTGKWQFDRLKPEEYSFWDGLESRSVFAHNVTRHVDDFCTQYGPLVNRKTSSPHSYVVTRARQLLRHAAESGSLDDVRTLCLWMLATSTFTAMDSEIAVTHYGALTQRSDEDELIDFYGNLFATSAYRGLVDFSVRRRHEALIIASAAMSHPGMELHDLTVAMVGEYQFMQANDALYFLDHTCQHLANAGGTSLAADMFIMVQERRQHLHEAHKTLIEFQFLAERIIDEGLKSGQLSASARLLRWKYNEITGRLSERERVRLNDFIKACGMQGMHATLVDLFVGEGRMKMSLSILSRTIDDEGREALAIACSSVPKLNKVFTALYRTLPPAHRQKIDRVSYSEALRSRWRSTRNLYAIEAEVPSMRLSINADKDHQAMHELNEAVLEIYVDAGKIDKALTLLQQMQKANDIDKSLVSLAGLLFAGRGKWDELRRLLDYAEKIGVGKKHPTTSDQSPRVWDRVINMFSLVHSAEETRKFVIELTVKVGFAPTVATGKIILTACVRSRSLSMAVKWLAHLESIGVRLEFNSKIAARMVTEYWITTRPKHKRLMWLCHFIHRHIPSFEASHFRSVLMAAIGYDLRNLREQDLDVTTSKNPVQHALVRLDLLEHMQGIIPIPGWTGPKGDRRLMFNRGNEMFANNPIRYLPTPEHDEDSLDQKIDGTVQWTQYDRIARDGDVDAGSACTPSLPARVRTTADSTAIHSTLAQHLRERFEEGLDANDNTLQRSEKLYSVQLKRGFGLDNETSGTSTPGADSEEAYHAMIAEFNLDESHSATLDKAESTDYNREVTFSTTESGDRERLDNCRDEGTISFERLRPEESMETGRVQIASILLESNEDCAWEPEMVKALSLTHHEAVLDLYRQSLDPAGLPWSVRTLEIAVEACLRLHKGNIGPAEELLASAAKSGMNVTCAIGPLIIHKMRNLKKADRQDANKLRVAVIDYYRMNDMNGWPLSHHLAVSAANLLISNQRVEYGLNLLTAVYNSEWTSRRPLDTPAMTVFLKGYRQIRSLSGVEWAVKHVLTTNMRVTAMFMRQLKLTYQPPETRPGSRRAGFSDEKARDLLRSWAQTCYKRRLKQIDENFRFGLELERTIKECARFQGLRLLSDDQSGYRALHPHNLYAAPLDLDTHPDKPVHNNNDKDLVEKEAMEDAETEHDTHESFEPLAAGDGLAQEAVSLSHEGEGHRYDPGPTGDTQGEVEDKMNDAEAASNHEAPVPQEHSFTPCFTTESTSFAEEKRATPVEAKAVANVPPPKRPFVSFGLGDIVPSDEDKQPAVSTSPNEETQAASAETGDQRNVRPVKAPFVPFGLNDMVFSDETKPAVAVEGTELTDESSQKHSYSPFSSEHAPSDSLPAQRGLEKKARTTRKRKVRRVQSNK
jgi:hypothetical protein